MSFSKRLTTFFVLMVLVPIIGIGALGFRLIDATSSGKAGARAGGLVTTASEVYTSDEATARSDAEAVVQSLSRIPLTQARARLAQTASAAGLVALRIERGGHTVVSIGARADAVAPGTVDVRVDGVTVQVTASTTTAAQFVQSVSGPMSAATLSAGGRVLASTLPRPPPGAPPPSRVTVGGVRYATDTYRGLLGFDTAPVTLTMLSDVHASTNSDSDSDLEAAGFLAALAVLAFGFAVLASRGLNEMVKRFLAAALRLADRDFSARVPVEGDDEFARLATAFNTMSDQLQEYIDRLDDERGRLRESIRLTGETFASSLDKRQLEAISLSTALTGVRASFGRMTWRNDEAGPLKVVQTEGPWREGGQLLLDAERRALGEGSFGAVDEGDLHVMAARMGTTSVRGLAYGTLAVGRRGEPFSRDDVDLFRSLAAQAWRALDNVRLHDEADRKAVTDQLTGLANHGQFQQVLGHELESVRRYQYPVGLILLDLDNFKQVNDTHGHQQGDAVLRAVSEVLSQTSREGDTAARYGGEEMALILPHTDLDGAATIAERLRQEIAALAIPMVEGDGEMRITASVGVSATMDGEKEQLIAEADSALYQAKRTGKNRVARARSGQPI